MIAASFSLLTPSAAVVCLAALLPIAAALSGRSRTESIRRELRLPAPSRLGMARVAALAGAIVLVGLAAAQPVLTSESSRRVRGDAQALFVIDTSRSMGASGSANGPTRLDRATAAASRLRAAIPQVESGVATLTDRVLPDLLPVADEAGFDAVVSRAVAIESPPPSTTSVRATSFGALAAIPAGGYFAPAAKTRVVVLLTDGESVATDTAAVARTFGAPPGYKLLTVRFWQPGEAIYRGAKREPAYRPDPTGAESLAALAQATRGRAVEEGDLGAGANFLERAVGNGPTVAAAGTTRTQTPLAPYLIALALLLLAAVAAWPALERLRSRLSGSSRGGEAGIGLAIR